MDGASVLFYCPNPCCKLLFRDCYKIFKKWRTENHYFWVKQKICAEQIHQMYLVSCTINALSVSRKRSGYELSRECLMVSDGHGQKLQFVISDFSFKFYLNLWVLVRFPSWNLQFILLFVKLVFSGYKSLSLKIQDNS